MSRPIDADKLIEKHCADCSADVREGCKTDPICGTIMWLDEAPTITYADLVPHGRWERTPDGAAFCTACKRKMNPSLYGYGFCGLCGAKMDGGNEK